MKQPPHFYEILPVLHSADGREPVQNRATSLRNTSKPRCVTVRNVDDGIVQLSRSPTKRDVAALQSSLTKFTLRHGLTPGTVRAVARALIIYIPDLPTGTLFRPFSVWFNAECDRIDNEPPPQEGGADSMREYVFASLDESWKSAMCRGDEQAAKDIETAIADLAAAWPAGLDLT